MRKQLLDKTLRIYILFSGIVLITSAPLFYFLADKLFIDDADEALLLRKQEFITYNIPSIKQHDIAVWNTFNRDIKIEEYIPLTGYSIFYRFYLDTLANENEPYRVLLSPVTIDDKPFVFMARINLVESEDMIAAIALLFLILVSALLIGLYFITRRLSKKLWQPFYSTLQNVEHFELDKSTRADFIESDIEEFHRLNQSIGRLLVKNVATYKSQKEFIENASHELQTPLASFQAKLDMLAQQLPFTEELGITMSDLSDAVSRLTRVNKNLLLLSRIENEQFTAQQDVSVNEILNRQLTFFAEQAEEKNITIQLASSTSCTKRANITLAEIAVSNLLLNAIRYNKPAGEIVVSVNETGLRIGNTGDSAPLSEGKLFQRFSQPGSAGGNGLGLAIVKKISDIHGWRLSYEFERNMHVFRLSF